QLGIKLPSDYRDFGIRYGTGEFNDNGRTDIVVYNPFSARFRENVLRDCEMLQSILQRRDFRDYGVFPTVPGLLPWGRDVDGCSMYYLTEGPSPETWPILTRPPRTADFERFDMTLTSFLAASFTRQIKPGIYWEPTLFSGPGPVTFEKR